MYKSSDIFLGKKLLFITAHPDDESYVAAGTIYKNYQLGGVNYLICGTLGEKGTSHLKRVVTLDQMKKIRKRELAQAATLLHIKRVIHLGLSDGSLNTLRQLMLQKTLLAVKKLKPSYIVSFGQDGISGHQDHIVAGEVAHEVARKLHISFIAFALPRKITRHAHNWLKKRQKSRHYVKMVAYASPNVRVSINVKIKKGALRAHQSQMDNNNAFTGFPKFAVKELIQAEYFRI